MEGLRLVGAPAEVRRELEEGVLRIPFRHFDVGLEGGRDDVQQTADGAARAQHLAVVRAARQPIPAPQ
eukprot:1394351-Pyramimonas_sp.AAC.1